MAEETIVSQTGPQGQTVNVGVPIRPQGVQLPQQNVPPQPQPGQRQFNAAPKQEEIPTIRWYPLRHSNNEIYLSDGLRILGLPDDVMGEPDPQSRIVLALLGEIMTISDRVALLEQKIEAASRPNDTPVPELRGEAAAFRNQAEVDAAKEGAPTE